jgi:hypothetical protein
MGLSTTLLATLVGVLCKLILLSMQVTIPKPRLMPPKAEEKQEMVQYGAGGLSRFDVRTLLVQPDLGDPAAPHHPARFRLRQRFQGKPNVFDVYDRALADGRLSPRLRPLLPWAFPPSMTLGISNPSNSPPAYPLIFNYLISNDGYKLARRGIHLAQKQAVYLRWHVSNATGDKPKSNNGKPASINLSTLHESLHGGSPC